MNLFEDLAKFRRVSRQQRAALLLAACELAVARVRTAVLTPTGIVAPPPPQDSTTDPSAESDVIALVGWAVATASSHVPWRADCLIQATAARRWLARRGRHSELHIG